MATSVDELRVIRSLQNGDRECFDDLVRQYRPGLLAYARRRTPNATAAEDAVQETFLRAYRSIGRLSDDSRLGPWLYRILGNVCIDDSHRRSREMNKVAKFSADPVLTQMTPSVEHQLGLGDDTSELTRALAGLPDGYREALTLRFVDELSYGEVAKASGLSEVNARARVSRARNAMRIALHGVAAVPMFFYVLLRRSDRTAHAVGRLRSQAGSSGTAQAASTGAAQANRFATLVSPALESATNIASATPMAAPMVGRIAAGATVVMAATIGVSASQNDYQAAVPVAIPETSTVVVMAPVATSAPVVVQTTAEAPTTLAAEVPDTFVVATTVAVTATTLDLTPYVLPTVATVATVAPAATLPAPVSPGDLLTTSLTVTASGPRYDISGSATLTVGGTVYTGTIEGRIGIDEALEGEAQSPLSGELSFTSDTGEVIELAPVRLCRGSARSTRLRHLRRVPGFWWFHRVGRRRHLLRFLRARLPGLRPQPLTRGDGPSSCPPCSVGYGRGRCARRPGAHPSAGRRGRRAMPRPPPSGRRRAWSRRRLEGWPNAVRYSGNDRYQTNLTVELGLRGIGDYPFDTPDRSSGGASVLATAQDWWGAGTCPWAIIVVTGDNPADSLGASALSDPTHQSTGAALHAANCSSRPSFDPIGGFARVDTDSAPILITASARSGATSLTPATRIAANDLRRGGCTTARQAIIVGGTSAVPAGVDAELLSLGYREVFRVAGTDRYDTAARVAQSLGTRPAPVGTSPAKTPTPPTAPPASLSTPTRWSSCASRPPIAAC